MKAFEITANGKVLDYRKNARLNLEDVNKFFEKNYIVDKIWQENRHVLGVLQKDGTHYFLKLATTEGISLVTESEFNWNKQFNNLVSRKTDFWVPTNFESGFYKKNLFYMVNEYFDGELFAKRPTAGKIEQTLKEDFLKIIELSELIQKLDIDKISIEDSDDFQTRFFEKTQSWYNEVPKEIIEEYKVEDVLNIVEKGHKLLERKTRHGDFTPWHMIKLKNGKIGLIDGERALRNSVEYYDIGYLIQRIFSVMENPEFAEMILSELMKRNYDLEKLKIILAARAIGGFCDEVLIGKEMNFDRANKFAKWVLEL